jgi:hypothetical protein
VYADIFLGLLVMGLATYGVFAVAARIVRFFHDR